ncbi:NACHT domain-containing protein [Candidatus Uabimicrobium amorphum]|uniref:NACHT domain-containing protein n=1 Tax=Uabimicrobium amorphum TaxID=2596890 RepID=UPI00156771E9|nr:NACHT domain-containing protein [Candidatus Uabimicrobium amorphum]
MTTEQLKEFESELKKFEKYFFPSRNGQQNFVTEQHERLKKYINVAKNFQNEKPHTSVNNFGNIFEEYLRKGPPEPLQTEEIGTVFVDKSGKGIPGKLTLTMVNKKGQHLFCCPEKNRFLITDNQFDNTITNIKKYITNTLSWQKDHSICWQLCRNDGQHLDYVEGSSLGCAFAIALQKILRKDQQYSLKTVVCSAEVDKDGNLKPVGHIHNKIKTVSQDTFFSTFVLALHDYNRVSDASTNLKLVGAVSIADAFEKIISNQETRKQLLKSIQNNYCNLKLFNSVVLSMEKNYQNIQILEAQRKDTEENPDENSHQQNNLHQPDSIGNLAEKYLDRNSTSIQPNSINTIDQQEKNTDNTQYTEINIYDDKIFSKNVKKTSLIITGAPGSGKSTMMCHIAWTLATKTLKNNYEKIPIKIKLSSWEESKSINLSNFLEQQSNIFSSISEEQWHFWLKRGDIFLLFDGLDEIKNSLFLDTHIQPTLEKYSNCSIIMTCRTTSLYLYQRLAGSMQICKIAKLNKSMRDNYVKKFPGLERNFPNLINLLTKNKSMEEISYTPFILSMICYLAGRDLQFPKKRSEFFQKIINALFENTSASWKGNLQGNTSLLMTSKKAMILSNMVWEITSHHGILQNFSEENLLCALEVTLAKHNISNVGIESSCILREFAGKCGILRQYNESYYFQHLSLQEYLIAKTIANNFNKNIDDKNALIKFKNNMQKTHWHYIVLFVLEMTENENVLFKLLQDISKFYFIYTNWEDPVSVAVKTLKEKSPKLFYRLLNKIIRRRNQDLFYNQLFFATKIIGMTESYGYKKRKYIIKRLRKLISISYYTKKVCEAYVDLQAKEHIQDILPILEHEWWNYREQACKTIGLLGSRDNIPHLKKLINDPECAEKAWEIIFQYANEKDLEWIDEVLLLPADVSKSPRENPTDFYLLRKYIKFIKEDYIQKILPRLLSSHDRSVQNRAFNMLCKLGNKSNIKYLEPYFEDPRDNIREICCQTIRNLKATIYFDYIKKCLHDPYSQIRITACYTMMELYNSNDLTSVLHCRYDTNFFVVNAFCRCVGKFGTSKDVEKLMDIIRNRDEIAIEFLKKHAKQELTTEILGEIRFHASMYDQEKMYKFLDQTGVHLASDFFGGYILGETICDTMLKIATHEHIDLIFEILRYFNDVNMTSKAAKLFLRIAKPQDWQKIIDFLSDESDCLRSFAYNAMYESGKVEIYANDLAKALYDNNYNIVREACWMLTEWEAQDKIDHIVQALQHSDDGVKTQVLSAIEKLGNRQHLKYVKPLLESENQHIIDGAWRVFEKMASDQELLELKPSLKSKQKGFRSHSVTVYENRASRQHIETIIIPKLSNENEYREACDVLAEAGANEDFLHLLPLLSDNSKAWTVYHSASQLVGENNILDILPLLKKPGWHVRRCACWLLRDIGKPENIPHIYPLIKDKNDLVSYSAYESIQKIAQRNFEELVLFKYKAVFLLYVKKILQRFRWLKKLPITYKIFDKH